MLFHAALGAMGSRDARRNYGTQHYF